MHCALCKVPGNDRFGAPNCCYWALQHILEGKRCVSSATALNAFRLQAVNFLTLQQLFYGFILPFITFFGLFAYVIYPNASSLHPTGVTCLFAAFPAGLHAVLPAYCAVCTMRVCRVRSRAITYCFHKTCKQHTCVSANKGHTAQSGA